ncbi:proline-rich proteoglycan 2-like [Choloepus didactylus]|uniref:proline-rich proteoglycan 2-like n=1 Tax=Choloepus didactylus TaxID=27675 RepID=UPI00189D8D02|nr:proline-rich proteoglycan 2-like [Choloepus didactylus]
MVPPGLELRHTLRLASCPLPVRLQVPGAARGPEDRARRQGDLGFSRLPWITSRGIPDLQGALVPSHCPSRGLAAATTSPTPGLAPRPQVWPPRPQAGPPHVPPHWASTSQAAGTPPGHYPWVPGGPSPSSAQKLPQGSPPPTPPAPVAARAPRTLGADGLSSVPACPSGLAGVGIRTFLKLGSVPPHGPQRSPSPSSPVLPMVGRPLLPWTPARAQGCSVLGRARDLGPGGREDGEVPGPRTALPEDSLGPRGRRSPRFPLVSLGASAPWSHPLPVPSEAMSGTGA